jgi:adenylate cyclase
MGAERLRDLKLCGLALAVMIAFAWVHAISLDVPSLRRLELSALDAQVRLRGSRSPGPEILIVMIDDRTIAELGQWPPPRRTLAEAVIMLHGAGAKAIGIDILYADPSPPAARAGDVALAQAIGETGNVVLPFTFEFGTRPGSIVPPALARAAYVRLSSGGNYRSLALAPTGIVAPLPALADRSSLGHMLVAFDVDGAPRYDYPALAYDAEFYPSMAVRIAQLFLGLSWSEVGLELGRGVTLGRLYVPTDPQMRLLVDYLGPSPAFPTYSLSQVLAGAVPGSVFRDRIVLIGANVAGTRDTFASPFTTVMPGVERLATVIDSILHERHLRRPAAAQWLEIAAMLAAALVLGLVVSRLSLAVAFVVAVMLVSLFAGSAQFALTRYGLWQASAVPILAVVLTFVALSLYRYGLLDKERRHIRRVFHRYLAPQMVDRLVSEQKLPKLGGELRELTVLFSDLRGFTALSERLEPTVLTRVVNAFLSAATEAILEHGGTVDKYVGDAIMAFWNAPLDQPDHAPLACRAALRIVEKLEAVNQQLADEGLPTLVAGIGINTGRCTVGNFGSSRRLDYSAVGDAVNVSARLEGETKNLGFAILLGPETAARVAEFATIPLERIPLRGRVEPIEVHALVGDETVRESPSFRELLARRMSARVADLARSTGGLPGRPA